MVFDPWFLVFDHGIENGEKIAHGCDEGDLFGFADCAQVPVKLADHRVVPGGGQGGHVQGSAHLGPPPSQGYFLSGNRWVQPDRWVCPAWGRAKGGGGHWQRRCEGRKAPWGRKYRGGGARGAEDRGGRGVERAMEECDAGPAPTARVGSGVAGARPAQARAEIGAGRRSQPHASPQITAQQQAP